ncbi:MAG: tyrosine--tRNA ligase [Pseudomonadota bacterium]
MSTFKSDFLNHAFARGFVHQGTDLEALDSLMAQQSVVAYIGFDASADSLHVGSLVQIMRLRWLQKTGHKPIVLMGGGTTRIGDPSDKDSMRRLLSTDAIKQNIAKFRPIFERFLTFGKGATDAILLDNSEWLDPLNYLDFLQDYGRHFSINRMLTFEGVKRRLDREQSLSFLEFNYMILQAYDFLELYRKYGCRLQLGGSDQWGNIINGVELVRRIEGCEVFGLTAPLITTADGGKMGKTAQGAVWLTKDKLPTFEFWQFWRNTQDADVGKFLRLFTELPIAEIEKLERLEGAEINEAKKILADEVTRLVHGQEAVDAARATAESLFETHSSTNLEALPVIEIKQSDFDQNPSFIELLHKSGLAGSKGDARRLIRGQGARLNDQVVQDEAYVITPNDFADGKTCKLSAGKKRHALLKLV